MGASPSLINIRFIDNQAQGSGGALDCGAGSPVVRGCVFINNSTPGMGGAAVISSSTLTFTDCVFEGNFTTGASGQGGGLMVYGSPTISNCTFHGCSSELGGGMSIVKSSSPTIINCSFSDNHAVQGGGIGLYYANLATVVNTVIAHSTQGGAVGGPNGAVNISCCNLFGNAGGDWAGPVAGQGGINGNISLDPRFVEHGSGDLHILFDSPCRNAGDASASGLPLEDFEGDPRKGSGAVDMGADEYHRHLYQNGDAKPGGAVKMNFVGLPGTSQVALVIGFAVFDPPLPGAYGDWYMKAPMIILAGLPAIPPEGVFTLPGALPPVPAGPYTVFLQAMIGYQLTNLCRMDV